jgi:hypothetical protein
MPGYGTTRRTDRLIYGPPNPLQRAGSVLPYAGLPIGALDFHLSGQLYVNNFQKSTDFDTTNDWTLVETAASTQALSDDVFPSYLRLTTTANDNEHSGAQFTNAASAGEIWRIRASKQAYFGVRFRTGAATRAAAAVEQANIFMGLQITNADNFGQAVTVTDYLGFYKNDGDPTFYMVTGKNNDSAVGDESFWGNASTTDGAVCATGANALTLTSADAVDYDTGAQDSSNGVWHHLGLLVVPTTTASAGVIYTFVDGVHFESIYTSSALCDDTELCPTIGILNGEAAIHVLDIAQIVMWQEF